MFLSDYRFTRHTMVYSKDNQQSIDIEMINGDHYFRDFEKQINFIKMDIQGAEIDAINGMSSLLQKMTDVKMMIEFQPRSLKEFGKDPLELLENLKKLGFKLFEMDRINKKTTLVNTKELIKKYPERGYTNLLCTKNSSLKFHNTI